MCAIVDANMATRFFTREPDLLPLWKWIDDGKGVLVVGGALTTELLKVTEAARAIQTWLQAGRAATVEVAEVEAETRAIEPVCSSDDPHVIALARVSGARLLCSSDRDLHADFRNPALISNPRGAVYQNASHAHLLRPQPGCRFKAPAQ